MKLLENDIEQKKVLISIDTEGPCGMEPVEHLIYGVTAQGERAGIELLMDIFDSNGVKGLFFVDIAEAWDYGHEKIKTVLKLIDNRGHDVGVHIHPDHMADRERRYLWQYTKEEQKKIILDCTEFYVDCLGRRPLSFRAGRYGVNRDTLEILVELGYRYDMSEFYGSRYCKIDPPITCNKIVGYKNLVEIPVTVFKSFKTPLYQRFDKIDVSLDKGEFKKLADKMIYDKSIDIVSFFVHSFSMLKWRNCYDSPKFIEKEAKKIDYMVKYMKKKGYLFICEDELKDLNINIFNGEKDITDYSTGLITWLYFLRRAFRVVKARIENDV